MRRWADLARCSLAIAFCSLGLAQHLARVQQKPAGTRKVEITTPRFERMELLTGGKDGHFCYHAPGLVVSSKGTVLAFCEARKGNCRDWTEIDLVLKRSFDNGLTWQPMQTIAHDGTHSMNQPTPVLDHETGTIWLAFCKNNQQVFVVKSTDDGASWSRALEITAGVKDPSWSYLGSGPGHGIQLKSGRLLIPSWGDASPRPSPWPPTRADGSRTWDKVQFSFLFYSDDHGATWRHTAPLTMDLSDECEVVELEDGTVYLNARSRQGKRMRAYARSTDGGLTWSEVRFDETLPEPSCQGSLIRFTDKPRFGRNRVLLFHPSSITDRSKLTMRLSYDECRTWPVSKIVYDRPSRPPFAYSDLAIAADRSILCLYSNEEHLGLTLDRFNIEWLTEGVDSLSIP